MTRAKKSSMVRKNGGENAKKLPRKAHNLPKNNEKFIKYYKGGKNAKKLPKKAYQNIVKENEKFIKYYKAQKICKEEEWDDFIKSLKSDLHVTFRITGSKEEAKKMSEILEGELIKECLHQWRSVNNISTMDPLPWYPDNLAWQLALTKKNISFKFHSFLLTETENGTISRQEAVSMIPPLLLDIKSHHKVLDMCAGSKTTQIIEILHDESNDALPTGYVIANNIDNNLCNLWVHKANRLNSPCMAMINHDSTVLPNLLEDDGNGGTKTVEYDRILCDVPCSGDGTLRKNSDMWLKWRPANSLRQHMVQSKILRRGVELLSVGGRVVYSTCSLNPIENEAVIHNLLVETNGAVELVDMNNFLPTLKHSPGLNTWLVGNEFLDFYETFDNVPKKWRTVIRSQMFPPKPEHYDNYHLNRCIRILPHQQNTDALFVAVLQKVQPLHKKPESMENAEESTSNKRENENSFSGGFRKRKRLDGHKEDSFVFFKEREDVWENIKEYYEISNDFDSKCLLTRCQGEKKKNIYFISSSVKDLVQQNQQNIKFINIGIKMFVRCDSQNLKCAFRLAQEGLESIFPFIGGHYKIHIPKDDLITLLLDNNQKPPAIKSLSEGVQKQVENLNPGCCILIYTEENSKGGKPLVLHLSGWRGIKTLRCFKTASSTVHYLCIVTGDFSKYIPNKFKKSKEDEVEIIKTTDGEDILIKKE